LLVTGCWFLAVQRLDADDDRECGLTPGAVCADSDPTERGVGPRAARCWLLAVERPDDTNPRGTRNQ
jgi:hypothetical protein